MELNLNPFNLILFIGIIQGFTFGLLFFFVKRQEKYANRFLGAMLFVFALYLSWVVLIDTRIAYQNPDILYFPFSFILTLGPSIYFYTLSLTDARFRFSSKEWWHYSPVLLELIFHIFSVRESALSDIPTFETSIFFTFSPIIQLLGIISITTYSILSIRKIGHYEKWLSNEHANELPFSFSWLKKLLIGYAIIWLMWVPYTFVDFFFFDWMLSIKAYYPIYLFLSFFTLWIALEAYRRPEVTLRYAPRKEPNKNPSEDIQSIKEQAQHIQTLVEREEYFLQSDLSLSSLAEAIQYSPNVLSRIINNGLEKNFSDFVNEFRVERMKKLLHSDQYDHFTTEGIAYECGFNSRATAIRTFKKFTKMSPNQFRKSLKEQTV
jgi:AraC-like DNA-binding protein